MNNKMILEEFVSRTGAQCPSCGTSLTEGTSCAACGEAMVIGLGGAAPLSRELTTRWCLLFIPWFLMCYQASNEWVYEVTGILFRDRGFGSFLELPASNFASMLGWLAGWLTFLSPLVCLYLWGYRTRVNAWPAWGIGLGSAIAIIVWLRTLYGYTQLAWF